MIRRIKGISWVVSSALLLIIVVVLYSVKRTQLDAENFFEKAQNLEIGHASWNDVLRVVNSSHGETGGLDPCVSSGGNCTIVVGFRNVWLNRLHVAPPTDFGCLFGLKAYKLQSVEFEMISFRRTREEPSNWGAFVHVGMTTKMFPSEVERTSQESFFKIAGRPSSNIWGVMITPNAPAELRKLAYNFNFNCLSRFGGCKNTEEMLPVLKRKELRWGQDPWSHEFKSE